jgi:hypothetical protein
VYVCVCVCVCVCMSQMIAMLSIVIGTTNETTHGSPAISVCARIVCTYCASVPFHTHSVRFHLLLLLTSFVSLCLFVSTKIILLRNTYRNGWRWVFVNYTADLISIYFVSLVDLYGIHFYEQLIQIIENAHIHTRKQNVTLAYTCLRHAD